MILSGGYFLLQLACPWRVFGQNNDVWGGGGEGHELICLKAVFLPQKCVLGGKSVLILVSQGETWPVLNVLGGL